MSNDASGMNDTQLSRAMRIVSATMLTLSALFVWAWFAQLDEITTGIGKVIPSSHEQLIQSLEGGILAELAVSEGDLVDNGQVLARLDHTKTASGVAESAARHRAALARAARLQAEVNKSPLAFPSELALFPELITEETRLYDSRRTRLDASLAGIAHTLSLVRRELAITRSLLATGAASRVDEIRLEKQVSELNLKAIETQSLYVVQAREELVRANSEVETLASILQGRADSLIRLTHHSPVRGIVKNIAVTTIGGVIPPNGQLMQIVPQEERLRIEARISPRDIAFIYPGQKALVKITAYDYAIFGGLEGKVVTISPDTIQDEIKPDNFYYRVYIHTDVDYLSNTARKRFPIVPGMIAGIDIKTGHKTVLDYLIKPFNRAREALRER